MEKLGYEINPKGDGKKIKGGRASTTIKTAYISMYYHCSDNSNNISCRPVLKIERK